MKVVISVVAALFSASVFAADASPGMKAFAAIAPAAQDFASGNVRAGCKAFGAYEALKAMANISNTDTWTLRNLGFGEKSDEILVNFCSGPSSQVTKDQAAQAAQSISGNVGLESVGGR